jgi:hypothetical protein
MYVLMSYVFMYTHVLVYVIMLLQAAAIITAGSAISALTVGAVSCNHFDISPNNAGVYHIPSSTV